MVGGSVRSVSRKLLGKPMSRAHSRGVKRRGRDGAGRGTSCELPLLKPRRTPWGEWGEMGGRKGCDARLETMLGLEKGFLQRLLRAGDDLWILPH